jgi:hypothetical protein
MKNFVKWFLFDEEWNLCLLDHRHIQRPWLLPPGWGIERWEPPIKALERELCEELWIQFDVHTSRLLVQQILTLPDWSRHYWMYFTGKWKWNPSIKEVQKFWDSILWIPPDKIISPKINGLREDTRLLIIQAIRSLKWTKPELNIYHATNKRV